MSIQLVGEKDGRLFVQKEGADFINQITGRVSVIAVAGPYRTGKSVLLNKLLGKPIFGVGGTIKAHTRGLWVAGSKKGDGENIIVLDTEGLGSLEQSFAYDSQILTLALLLSSVLILNTMGTINESALDMLQLVVNCAQRLTDSSTASSNSIQFPFFYWILRDFSLMLQDNDGNPITSTEYLEQALRPQPANVRNAQEKNNIRKLLTTVFPARDCEVLVRPVVDEAKLQVLDKLPVDQLRKEFRDGLDRVKTKVFNTVRSKTFNSQYLNGPGLVHLINFYVTAMNSGKMPSPQTAWDSIATIQSKDAFDQAFQLYKSEISKVNQILEVETIFDIHNRLENAALESLYKNSIGDDDFKRQLALKLKDTIKNTLQEWMKTNELKSNEFCRNLIEEIWTKSGADKKNYGTAQEIENTRQQIVAQYLQKAVGPHKDQILTQYLESKMGFILHELYRTMEARQAEFINQKNHLEKIEKDNAEYQKELIRIGKDVEFSKGEQQRMQQTISDNQQRIQHLTDQNSQAGKEVLQLQNQKGNLEKAFQQLESEKHKLEQLYKDQQNQLQQQYQKNNELEHKLEAMKVEMQRQQRDYEGVNQNKGQLEKYIEDQQIKIQQLQQEYFQSDAQGNEKQRIIENLNRSVTTLQNEVQVRSSDFVKIKNISHELEAKNLILTEELSKIKNAYDALILEHQNSFTNQSKSNNELTGQLAQKNKEIESLRSEIQAVTTDFRSALEIERAEYQQEKQGLEKRIMSLLQEKDDLENNIQELKNQKGVIHTNSPKRPDFDNSDVHSNDDEMESSGDENYCMVSKQTPPPKKQKLSRLYNGKPPEKCTIQDLKSWLTSLDVELPPTKQAKQVYLDLLYKAFGDD